MAQHEEQQPLVHRPSSHLHAPAIVDASGAQATSTTSADLQSASLSDTTNLSLDEPSHSTSSRLLGGLEVECSCLPAGGAAAGDPRQRRARTATSVLVAVARVMERVDEGLLPSVYLYVGCSFGASPAQLGAITFGRALSQALSSPLGGILGHYFNRAHVIALSCVCWALCTALFACSTSLNQAVLLWVLNGIGLAAMVPNGQSMIADYYEAHQRGKAFGMLLAVGNLGSMLGTLYATNLGGRTILGMPGWRFVFLTIALYSAAVGVATWALAEDPRGAGWRCDQPLAWGRGASAARAGAAAPLRGGGGRGAARLACAADAALGIEGGGSGSAGVRGSSTESSPLWREVGWVLRTPTFIIIIIQGVFGSTPWSAMAFATLYFQLQGWSDAAASAVMAGFSAADAAGALLGGAVGDAAAKRFPDHGRIAACQFSVAVGVPLSLLLWLGLPLGSSPGLVAQYAALMAFMGLLISWAATACNNPVFAEIVPPASRTLVYAFDRSLEGALSAMGAPLVGLAAERWFGYSSHHNGSQAGACGATGGDPAAAAARQPDLVQARAIGDGIALFTALPWLLCAAVYTLLHFTYPRDRRRAAAAAAVAGAEGRPGGGSGMGLPLSRKEGSDT